MIPDFQRSKLLEVEAYVSKLDAEMPIEDVNDLVAEICRTSDLPPFTVIEGSTNLITTRASIIVPPWARKPTFILHSMAHLLTDPIFPPHGAEFACRWLELTAHHHPEDEMGHTLWLAFENAKIHHSSEIRMTRVRRVAVNIANNTRGKTVELVLDDPPERLEGPLLAANSQEIRIGEVTVPLERCRYLQGVS